jgi:hypothetical protein
VSKYRYSTQRNQTSFCGCETYEKAIKTKESEDLTISGFETFGRADRQSN